MSVSNSYCSVALSNMKFVSAIIIITTLLCCATVKSVSCTNSSFFHEATSLVSLFVNLGARNAIETGNVEHLKKIITEFNGELKIDQLLRKAAEIGNEQVVEILIQNGANINAEDEHQVTSMHFAALNSNEKVMDTLIKHGGNVNGSENRDTPLVLAAFNSNDKVLELLLDNGADIPSGINSEDILHFAAFNPNHKVMELLIKRHANVNADTLLCSAVLLNSNEKVPEVLIKAGADVNKEDDIIRMTPVFYSLLNVKLPEEACKLFRYKYFGEHGITKVWDICMERMSHLTNEKKQIKMLELLAQNGANLNLKHGTEEITLYEAADLLGNERMKKIIMEYGAKVNEP